MTNSGIPSFDIDLGDLDVNPGPIYETLRRDAPIAYVPSLMVNMLTRHDDIVRVLDDPETFSSNTGFRNDLVGDMLMQKDGAAHMRERKPLEQNIKPKVLKESWLDLFQANADALIDDFIDSGEADLHLGFATSLATMNLASVIGLTDVSIDELQAWCESIIEDSDDVINDPTVRSRGRDTRLAVTAAIDRAIERVKVRPETSMISAMVNAPDPLSPEQIYGNIMISIGAGLNEQRDVFTTGLWGLLSNPEQLNAVKSNPELWDDVFSEAARWVSPITMLTRRVTQPVTVAGAELNPGDIVGVNLNSANHDEREHPHPDVFDIHRPDSRNLAFSRGPHYCAGAWIARIGVATVAWPTILRRLPGLRLEPGFELNVSGIFFRGPTSLRVQWDVEGG